MSNPQTSFHIASMKKGLNMAPGAYSGPNILDGGTVASLQGHPQETTTQEYMSQNEGQNLMTSVPVDTIKASNQANLKILEDSQKAEHAQLQARGYMANILEHPNMESSATRKLADPQTLQNTVSAVATTNAQSKMFA